MYKTIGLAIRQTMQQYYSSFCTEILCVCMKQEGASTQCDEC